MMNIEKKTIAIPTTIPINMPSVNSMGSSLTFISMRLPNQCGLEPEGLSGCPALTTRRSTRPSKPARALVGARRLKATFSMFHHRTDPQRELRFRGNDLLYRGVHRCPGYPAGKVFTSDPPDLPELLPLCHHHHR